MTASTNAFLGALVADAMAMPVHWYYDQRALLRDYPEFAAGDPAASLRERLFVDDKAAGLLIYTASSDSAGSLGGVAAMAEPGHLGDALREGLQRLAWCSSDPV
jgi:hypothetical protein